MNDEIDWAEIELDLLVEMWNELFLMDLPSLNIILEDLRLEGLSDYILIKAVEFASPLRYKIASLGQNRLKRKVLRTGIVITIIRVRSEWGDTNIKLERTESGVRIIYDRHDSMNFTSDGIEGMMTVIERRKAVEDEWPALITLGKKAGEADRILADKYHCDKKTIELDKKELGMTKAKVDALIAEFLKKQK